MADQGFSLLASTVVASAALTANRGVAPGGGLPAANGRCLGPARSGAAIEERVTVDRLGTAGWEAGGAFAAGDRLAVDAQGRVVLYATGVVVGVAEEASSGAGAVVEVMLIPN